MMSAWHSLISWLRDVAWLKDLSWLKDVKTVNDETGKRHLSIVHAQFPAYDDVTGVINTCIKGAKEDLYASKSIMTLAPDDEFVLVDRVPIRDFDAVRVNLVTSSNPDCVITMKEYIGSTEHSDFYVNSDTVQVNTRQFSHEFEVKSSFATLTIKNNAASNVSIVRIEVLGVKV